MKVSPQEYNSLLYGLKDFNQFTPWLRIPKDEPIYEINLNERKIAAPTFLSVEEDHNSEVIWFKVARFYDNFDLYSTTCWIQYKNANNEEYFYLAPMYISGEDPEDNTLLIPWAISKEVAAKTGTVSFAFQFFKLTEDNLRFDFVLNTQVAKSKILAGMWIDPTGDLEETEEGTQLANEIHRLTEAYETLKKDYELYWIEA